MPTDGIVCRFFLRFYLSFVLPKAATSLFEVLWSHVTRRPVARSLLRYLFVCVTVLSTFNVT